MLLTKASDFNVITAIRETLWHSACGGGRGFTNGELDPEYRYILKQAEALANHYRGDTVLEPFYRMVAESERRQIEWERRDFREDDERS